MILSAQHRDRVEDSNEINPHFKISSASVELSLMLNYIHWSNTAQVPEALRVDLPNVYDVNIRIGPPTI